MDQIYSQSDEIIVPIIIVYFMTVELLQKSNNTYSFWKEIENDSFLDLQVKEFIDRFKADI